MDGILIMDWVLLGRPERSGTVSDFKRQSVCSIPPLGTFGGRVER